MDDLVLTGTLSLIAFFAIIIAGILAGLFFLSWVWSTAAAGNYYSILAGLVVILIAAGAYTSTGYYLFSKGWI